MSNDPAHVWEIFEKIRNIPNLLVDEVQPGHDAAKELFNPRNVVLEVADCGIVAIANLHDGYSAEVHVTFWDGMLRGKERVCRELAMDTVDEFHLKLLYTRIPASRKTTIAFAKRVGFTEYKREDDFVYMEFYFHGANSQARAD